MPPLALEDILHLAMLQAAGFIIGGFAGFIFSKFATGSRHPFKLWTSGFFALILGAFTASAVLGAQGPLYAIFILLSLIIPGIGAYLQALPAMSFGFHLLRR